MGYADNNGGSTLILFSVYNWISMRIIKHVDPVVGCRCSIGLRRDFAGFVLAYVKLTMANADTSLAASSFMCVLLADILT